MKDKKYSFGNYLGESSAEQFKKESYRNSYLPAKLICSKKVVISLLNKLTLE